MKRKIFSDVVLSMIANFIPIFALQFFIFPQVASEINPSEYGRMLAIVALINFSAYTLGSVMNNMKLLYFKNYESKKISGDFNLIWIGLVVINCVIMGFGLSVYGAHFSFYKVINILICSLLLLSSTYMSVEFRIKLNYNKILLSNILLSIGYIAGYIIFKGFGNWEYILLIGSVLMFLYTYKSTSILKEAYKKTELFKDTFNNASLFLTSGLLLSFGGYADKLLIFPLLGGETLSVYHTATIFGKTIAFAIGPITGVLLSYIAHMDKFEKKYFKWLISASFFAGTLGYIVVMIISKPILQLLYPQFVNRALILIPITTMTVVIVAVNNVLNSVLLKFCKMKWQVLLNLVFVISYVVLAMILLHNYGILGFCYGLLIANIIKLISIFGVYYYTYEDEEFRRNGEKYKCDTE